MINKLLNFFKKSIVCQHSDKKSNNIAKISATEEFERCVICGGLTFIPISMPIKLRENYVVGCGQICAECAKKER